MEKISIKNMTDMEKQILKIAKEHGNIISYVIIADLLKTEKKDIDEVELQEFIYRLQEKGVQVEQFESDESYEADGEEVDKFIPADVNINQIPMNIYNLMERLEYDEIELQPDFQRNGNLWSLKNQSRLIESLMLKIPLPAFYFDATDEESWKVIDGQQRLTAFKNFLIGEKKEKFTELQYLTEFNGLTFDELPRQYIRRIKEASVIAYTVEKGTPVEVVFNIFQRINTGGEPLNAQEIRHALYSGKSTELTKKLAESKEFLEATGYAISPKRMLDREYVNRYLAFAELDYKKEYHGNINNYLIKALQKVKHYDSIELNRVEEDFKRIMIYAKNIFGKYAFRKYNQEWRRGPVNKAIFELWVICFKDMSDEELDKLVENRQKFLEAFQTLLKNEMFVTALKAGDVYSLDRRVSMAKEMIREILC